MTDPAMTEPTTIEPTTIEPTHRSTAPDPKGTAPAMNRSSAATDPATVADPTAAPFSTVIKSPLGNLFALSDGQSITALYTPGHRRHPGPEIRSGAAAPVLAELHRQLDEYFSGGRREFDLPLAAVGTPFQQSVWAELRKIPYGGTAGYGQIAARLGHPTAVRAVGAANGRNPISLLVPCHRVVGADGSLTGYAGGVEAKRWLLDHERVTADGSAESPSGGPALSGPGQPALPDAG